MASFHLKRLYLFGLVIILFSSAWFQSAVVESRNSLGSFTDQTDYTPPHSNTPDPHGGFVIGSSTDKDYTAPHSNTPDPHDGFESLTDIEDYTAPHSNRPDPHDGSVIGSSNSY
ncbi:unnamed protein product [Calypogeia fissa]